MITNLETAIKTKLQTIDNFQAVYDHYTLQTTWYPYASFELSDFEGEFLDVCSNRRTFNFTLVVIQEVSGENIWRDQAKDILYACLDEIIEKFDGDQDLWEGTIVRGFVKKGSLGTVIEMEGSVLALQVEISLDIITVAGA